MPYHMSQANFFPHKSQANFVLQLGADPFTVHVWLKPHIQLPHFFIIDRDNSNFGSWMYNK